MSGIKIKLNEKGVEDLRREIAAKLDGKKVAVPCPGCGRSVEAEVGSAPTCPSCGLKFNVRA